jgi:hypothetical protein
MTLTMDPDTDEEEAADEPDADAEEYGHLDDLADGAGCTEIWEHLSDSREE